MRWCFPMLRQAPASCSAHLPLVHMPHRLMRYQGGLVYPTVPLLHTAQRPLTHIALGASPQAAAAGPTCSLPRPPCSRPWLQPRTYRLHHPHQHLVRTAATGNRPLSPDPVVAPANDTATSTGGSSSSVLQHPHCSTILLSSPQHGQGPKVLP